LCIGAIQLLASTGAFAWGDEGHRIIAVIAYARLTPAARAKVDAILASDKDTLTAPDFASRATWADRYRDSDRLDTKVHYLATRAWHFANVEIDGGTLGAACRAPGLPNGHLASQGPADDCVVHKVDEFAAELADARTSAAEKRLALKFLMHLVGDLHQPLHVADHHDRGGNAVPVFHGAIESPDNLHSYWDTRLVEKLGSDPKKVGAALGAGIARQDANRWSAGTPALWAQETFAQARDVAYDFGGESFVADANSARTVRLDATYEARALPVVREQLSKAGVRLAAMLNESLR
jgi:hypothetical protein